VKIDPAAAGLDEQRLERIDDHLRRRYLEPGKIAGCQTVVARGGHVGYFSSLGSMDVERAKPVLDDTIWRIYSMTKPITGVALMTLYERGHFQLDDPVHRFIPDFRDLKVRERAPDGTTTLVDPQRPMSVKDLLMHMSGLGFGSRRFDLTGESGTPTFELPDITLDELVQQLASRPLRFHPSTKWLYSTSTDVCGRLVEIISGRPLDEYFRTEIFEPLGMRDTGFSVPDDKIDRFAALYRRDDNRELTLVDDPLTSSYRKRPKLLSGGGGLVSTTDDYLRFCQMMLNGGELDGTRVLGRKTIELMTTNHLPGGGELASFATGFGEVGFTGVGFGLTLAIGLGPAATATIGSAGDYSWGGAASTIFWVDPAEELIVIFMVQFLLSGTYDFRNQLKALIYPAFAD
jgi:CubicO group peptidase (beta-lactamase class C family)